MMENMMEKLKVRPWQAVVVIILLVFSILSVAVFSKPLSSPGFYRETIQVLDNQKMKAAALAVTVTAASAAISALPDDIGASIADELDDLATPLFLIACVIFLEKTLLTTFGLIGTRILVPAICVIGIVYTIRPKEKLFTWIKKLLIITLAAFFVIPASAMLTSLIEETYSDTVTQTFDVAQQYMDETQQESNENSNAFLDFFSNIGNSVTALLDKAKRMLSVFIDAVAVLLITSCGIPIMTFLVFLWCVRKTFNANITSKNITAIVVSLQNYRRKYRKRNNNEADESLSNE